MRHLLCFLAQIKHTKFQIFLTYSDVGQNYDSEGPSTSRIQSVGIAKDGETEPSASHISSSGDNFEGMFYIVIDR